jgi:membrane-bound inhibitor of C-type lysozyme
MYRTLALTAAALLPFAATAFAGALPAGLSATQDAHAATPSLVIRVAGRVDGTNVAGVYYPGGGITMDNGIWVEGNADGSNTFIETHRDEWSVYLYDQSRDVYLQLDLHRQLILYGQGHNGRRMQPLYQITDWHGGAERRGGAMSRNSATLTYTCIEGIPLTMRLVKRGRSTFAMVSHDGGPELSLKKRSGNRYSDGTNSLVDEGDTLKLIWGENWDECTAD